MWHLIQTVPNYDLDLGNISHYSRPQEPQGILHGQLATNIP
jgi:hypothetical protein